MKSKNPVGIRFDLEKLEFVMNKESILSHQKVVDFLLNKYWWEYKVPIPTYKDVPPLKNKVSEVMAASPVLEVTFLKKESSPPETLYDTYYNKLEACRTVKEVESVVKLVEKESGLESPQKRDLKYFAQECSKNMYTD